MNERLFVSPTGNPVDGYCCSVHQGICQIPMGEGFRLDSESLYSGGFLVDQLLERATKQPNGLTRLQKLCSDIIGNFPGFNSTDARYWSRKLVEGSTWLHKVLPHWAFMLLSAGIDCPEKTLISTRPPVFVQLNQGEKKVDEPPELIGKIFPVFGWFDDYGWNVIPEFTITRMGSSGQRVFPGGHAQHPLDWPWRELTEEVSGIQIGRFHLSLESTKYVRKLRLAVVVDQTSRTNHRYKIYGFRVEVSDGPYGNFDLKLEEPFDNYSLSYYPTHTDELHKKDWEITRTDWFGNIADPGKFAQLNEVEKAIVANGQF